MKKAILRYCCLILLFGTQPATIQAQETPRFARKVLKMYWGDSTGRPWNDLSCKMAIRLDPQYAVSLGSDEIRSDDEQPCKYVVGQMQHFSLKSDATGTYAEPEVLVYAEKDEPVIYQVELQKGSISIPFAPGSSSKAEINNNSPSLGSRSVVPKNRIFLKDWLIVIGTLLLGAILLYVLVFRWLFKGLLFTRRWSVSKAENFTWSMSLLGMLGLASALTLLYLGPRPETWVIMGVMGAFFLLHAIVWFASGQES